MRNEFIHPLIKRIHGIKRNHLQRLMLHPLETFPKILLEWGVEGRASDCYEEDVISFSA
jgi:hypothetical protein